MPEAIGSGVTEPTLDLGCEESTSRAQPPHRLIIYQKSYCYLEPSLEIQRMCMAMKGDGS